MDCRPIRRNNAALSNFCGVVGPEGRGSSRTPASCCFDEELNMHLFCGKPKNERAANLKRKRITLSTLILLSLILLLYFTVDGGWSSWSDWKSCSKSCGTGFEERSRSCTSPAPSYGGKPCDGEARESRWCNTHSCPGKYRVGESLRVFSLKN